MRIYGCRACGSAWAVDPGTEADGSHWPAFWPESKQRCRGAIEPFLPESMVGTAASDVLRAEAIAAAAIARCEAVASQAQIAIAELYWERRTSGRAAVRAYRHVLRLERLESAVATTQSAPMSVMRALLAAESLLDFFARRRPCPSCRGPLDHRKKCRLMRLLDRILLLTSDRLPPRKIRRARVRRMKRGA